MNNKITVALVGPISCNGGISAVINSIANSEKIKNTYDLMFFNSSNYKDSSSLLNFLTFLKSLAAYSEKLLERKINLSHIHTSSRRSFYRKAIFILMSYFSRVKIVLHFHASDFNDYFISASGLKKIIISSLLKKCDSIVLLCKEWEEKLKKKYSLRNTLIIKNPIPFDFDQIKIDFDKKNYDVVKILFLGFLIKSKGVYDLIEIAIRLKNSPSRHKIILCGKGEESNKLQKIIKERNLYNLEYLGWASPEKKKYLLENSDIFLLPSYKEGMPVAILEAMSYGLPIVSTRIGGIPDIVIDGENGYLLTPGNIESFVQRINLLILDPNTRNKFGRRSRAIAEGLRKEKIALEWHNLYQKILR